MLKGNTHQVINEQLKTVCLSNQFAANFVKIYHEIKKLCAFEVVIYYFDEGRHICKFMTS